MLRQNRITVTTALLCVFSWAGICAAGVASTTGAVQLVAAPSSVAPGQHESNTVIHLFVERTDETLLTGLDVDMSSHYTTWNPPVGGTPATIPSNTVVSSYYLQLDPLSGFHRLKGSVTFDEPILGVIAQGLPDIDHLGASDFLGFPTTTYPSGVNYVGIETTTDNLRLYPTTLSLDIATISTGVDHVRVITAATGTPAPPTEIGVEGTSLRIKDRYREGLQFKRDLGFVARDANVNPLIVNPIADGAYVHVYSASDSICMQLPASGWFSILGGYKYVDQGKANGPCTAAKIIGGRLQIKCPPIPVGSQMVGYVLNEASQGTVDVSVTFGGVRYCATFAPPNVGADFGIDPVLDPDGYGFFGANGAPAPGGCPPSSCP
jgi:hypothetical protein